MNRYIIGVAVAAATATLGTGCGADESGSAYCTSFADATSTFRAIETGDLGELGTAVGTFHALAEQAPPEIEREWDTLDGAFVSLETGLTEAELSIDDLGGVATGDLPQDVDLAKLDQVLGSLEELGSPDVSEAADAIEAHGRDRCGVDLEPGKDR